VYASKNKVQEAENLSGRPVRWELSTLSLPTVEFE